VRLRHKEALTREGQPLRLRAVPYEPALRYVVGDRGCDAGAVPGDREAGVPAQCQRPGTPADSARITLRARLHGPAPGRRNADLAAGGHRRGAPRRCPTSHARSDGSPGSSTPSRRRRCRRTTHRRSCNNPRARPPNDPHPYPHDPESIGAGARRFKSAYSDGADNNCVEIAGLTDTPHDGIAVRDSKLPQEAALLVERAAFRRLCKACAEGVTEDAVPRDRWWLFSAVREEPPG